MLLWIILWLWIWCQGNTQLLMMPKLFCPRRGWLLQGLPVSMKGVGGPGAPHVFLFQRMCNSGAMEELSRTRNAKHHTDSTLRSIAVFDALDKRRVLIHSFLCGCCNERCSGRTNPTATVLEKVSRTPAWCDSPDACWCLTFFGGVVVAFEFYFGI